MRLRICVAFASVVVAAGCGGGAVSGDGGGRDLVYGPVIGRAVGGVAEPVTMSGSASTVVGVFGANFTSLSVNLPPQTAFNELQLLDQTRIAMQVNQAPALYDIATGSVYALSNEAPPLAAGISISGNGSQVVASEYDVVTSAYQLYTYNIDGTSRTRITSGFGLSATHPSWSPTANRIAYAQGNDIWAVNSNGSGVTQLTSAAEAESNPRFSPDGTKILYRKFDGLNQNLWQMTSTGTGPVQVTNFGSINGYDVSPTGNEVIVTLFLSSNYYLHRYNLITGNGTTLLVTADPLNFPTWSPTGGHVVYQRNVAGAKRMEMMRLIDRSITTLAAQTSETWYEWGPLVRKKAFVGASGAHHTNAAGFLYGTYRSDFRSLVTFDATTRNTVDIDATPPTTSSSNYVATITAADSITMLRYNNGIANPRVTIVDPAQPATYCQGAIVSFDSSNGTVSAVLPFTRSRSGEKPTQTEEATGTRVRGEFLSVWDGKGQKLADSANEVLVERATGKVTIVR